MAAAMVPLEVALSGAIGARYVDFVLFASGLPCGEFYQQR